MLYTRCRAACSILGVGQDALYVHVALWLKLIWPRQEKEHRHSSTTVEHSGEGVE